MAALTLARAYQHSFDAHPHITLAVTGGTLNALGDCVAQVSERSLGKQKADPNQSNPNYDFARTFRFFAYGFALSPFLGRWNAFLETRFPFITRLGGSARSPQTQSRNLRTLRTRGGDWAQHPQPHATAQAGQVSWLALSKRVAADQMIMAPAGLVMFIGAMGIMEGRSRKQIKEKYKDMYSDAIIANWKVWPLAQLINFRFMPLPYRVPFSQVCGVFWTLYLSMLNAREDDKQDHQAIVQQQVVDWGRDHRGLPRKEIQGDKRV
ncbi:hypothetical protein BKA70DRAFT_1252655 [Coprinopsis sp. MPI-PUGE-AT-0042]|nr:hypothetical protein BKA70DRAFT_1252655 [Coprinopsis sp. MPI-PUGE-AT-0042]